MNFLLLDSAVELHRLRLVHVSFARSVCHRLKTGRQGLWRLGKVSRVGAVTVTSTADADPPAPEVEIAMKLLKRDRRNPVDW